MAGSGLSVAGRSFLHMSPVLMDLGSYVWPDLTPAASLSSKYSHENLTIHSQGQYWGQAVNIQTWEKSNGCTVNPTAWLDF